MNHRILMHNQTSNALTPQKKIDLFNFPFTLNMNIGCLYACRYCYLQKFPFSHHAEFGKEVKVKLWIPEKLDLELEKYRDLPQHLKRVQVNPATEGLHPKVLQYTRDHCNRDLVRETLQVFLRHWNAGNHWMVHFVTKSNSVTDYVDLLTELKHMVQVEITIITANQQLSRQVELYTPSVNARLRAVETLSKAGIFVRVMAMPFMTTFSVEEQIHDDLVILKELCFNRGAIAFKNKGLNYFDESDVQAGEAKHKKGQEDQYFADLIIRFGEPILDENGAEQRRSVLMPQQANWHNWAGKSWRDRMEARDEVVVNCGYGQLNEIEWGNIL